MSGATGNKKWYVLGGEVIVIIILVLGMLAELFIKAIG